MHGRRLLLLSFIIFPIYLSCASPREAGNQPVVYEHPTPDNLSSPPQIVRPTAFRLHRKYSVQIMSERLAVPVKVPGSSFSRPDWHLDRLDHLYVADSGNNRIQVVDFDGNFVTEFGSRGWRTGEFDQPTTIAINFQRTEILYVIDTGNNRVQYCNLVDRIFQLMLGDYSDGNRGNLSTGAQIELDLPSGIGIGRNGEIYVVDTGNNRFIQVDSEGRQH